MSLVDELLAMPGVVVAGEYTYKAETSYYKAAPEGEITEDYARVLGAMCYATTKGVVMTGNMIEQLGYRTRLQPERGWMLRGPEFTICVVANVFCFFNNSKGSPNQILGHMRKVLADSSMDLV